MNNRRRGKDFERWLAKDLGGRRIGLLGQEDVIIDKYRAECKERKKLPMFIKKCMAQAISNCRDAIPIVILHELNSNHNDDLVIMRYADWKEIK